jgi:DNA mismatch repair protein MutS
VVISAHSGTISVRMPGEALSDGILGKQISVRNQRSRRVIKAQVKPGPADRSYGVQVAKLAGLPIIAVRRAEAVLKRLETKEASAKRLEELPLFAAFSPAQPRQERTLSEAEKMLAELDPDALTPKEALELIYRLKAAVAPASR